MSYYYQHARNSDCCVFRMGETFRVLFNKSNTRLSEDILNLDKTEGKLYVHYYSNFFENRNTCF